MSKYLLSLDQGTTGTTAVLIHADSFKLVDKINEEFPQIYPKPGYVEHNLNDIWNTVKSTVSKLLEKNNLNGSEILTIGITNQRETTCAFNSKGEALHNAIVWQDRRTTEFCEDLQKSEHANYILKTTGLTLDPYFSGSKMNYLLNNSSKVQDSAKVKDLHFGTIDTFLLFKLSGHESFKTESSNASRTLLMDLKTSKWDDKLLDIFEINKDFLPEICDSFHNFGETKGLSFLPDGIPITGILGDQQAALFGQAGFNSGDMKCTYGTGAFFLMNTGDTPITSTKGLLTTVAYKKDGKTAYALEGSSYIAGAAVQWLRDNLKIIKSSPEIESLAKEVTNLEEMKHVMFLPFFTGIGSPYWNPNAKAALVGLTRDTSNKHIARACLDGIALSIDDLIDACRDDIDFEIKSLKVDGGACANDLLMNIQSTVSELEIIRPEVIETTAYGAALAAGIGIGIVDFDKIASLWAKDASFNPKANEVEFYKEKRQQWTNYIAKAY